MEIEEGQVVAIQTAVLDNAFRSLLYPDTRLLERLQKRYGNLSQRNDVTVLKRGQLPQFWDAIKEIFAEEGLELPA